MSQNNSTKSKFQGFPTNQARGHTEFGQAGYPQQYSFPPGALPGGANELSKQVQAAQQQGMYAASSAQAAMGPPSASPQQPNPMGAPQQQQHPQLGRAAAHAIPNYYRGNVVPRTLSGLGRAPLTTVVNQGGGGGTPAGQQPPSATQYGHTVQMVPSHAFHHHHPMQPIIVNAHHQLAATQMYQQRPYNPQQYSVVPTGQQIYLNNHWSNYNNVAATNSNGYYQPHPALSSYNAMPPQLPPQMGGTQQPAQSQPMPPAPNRKNPLPIIDPTTGKNILDGLNQEAVSPPRAGTLHEKETENADPNICVQFATQVAAALANNDKSDIPTKVPPIMDARVIPDPRLCPPESPEEEEEAPYRSSSRPESFYEAEPIPSPDEPYQEESPVMVRTEPLEVVPDLPPCEEVCRGEEPARDAPSPPAVGTPQEKGINFCDVQELNKMNAQVAAMDVVGLSNEEPPHAAPVVESHEEPAPAIEEKVEILATLNSGKSMEKPSSIESKKNKARKKKDLNKRGESKEGGEMDAFLDKGPEEERVPPVVEEQRSPSPVPVVDSNVLDSIPLPPDPAPSSPNGEKAPEDKENASAEDPKLILKYEYKEDQWSPLNPEGKKQYDRDFLLQLQSEPMSIVKPTNLPNLDVIKDKAHIQRLTEVSRVAPMSMPMKTYNDPFVPTYARGGAQRPPHPSLGNRRSQQGGRGLEKPKKVISFSSSLNQAVKLHESENAWKPVHKLDGPVEDTVETQELYRKVRGILNKLTPQKFETLVEQVKGLDITTEEKLNGVIDLVFEKAIDEPNFSVPYANMCKQLVRINVPLAGQSGQFVNFRKLLLTKCQKEFEQDTRDEMKKEERLKAIEVADPDKKKELQFEFDEEEKKMRYRQLGNIRFIGELFKLSMLTEPIMHDCIQKLLPQGDEESLECLCRLLKTIGKELEGSMDGKQASSRAASLMDTYFAQMQKVVEKRLTTSRVRFMLQDVIDLRKNNWVPRRDENNPKTIDQIHKEVEREAREQQQSYQNMPPSASPYPKRMSQDDRKKGIGRISEDGWIPSSKSNKGSYMVDPTKLKLTKPDEVESMRLGPGGRGLQSWGRGSSGGTAKTAPTEEKAPAALTTNRYSALADQTLTPNYEGRRGSQRSAASSRESSRGRSGGAGAPPSVRKTSSTSKERESLLETVKGMARAGQAQEPRAQQAPQEPPAPKRAPSAEEPRTHLNGKVAERDALTLRGPELNDAEMEKKTKPLIDEFLHNADYEEAIKCVTELCCPSTVHLFIEAAVNQVLERSSQARSLLGQLFYLLTSRQIFTLQQYKKGLGRVLNNVDDFALDIPLIWDYMGEILEPMVEDNKLPLSFLKEVLEPCRPSPTAGKLVSAVLCSAKKKGTIKLGEAWRESGLQWTDFLGTSENVQEFVQTHKLEFTVTPTKTPPLAVELPPEELRKELSSLLQNKKKNEEIFDWIDANVSQKASTEPAFIRALVTAVHENAIHGSGQNCELVQLQLKDRIPLLTRYIEHKENLELQALYAIQSLMNQLDQPKGVLRQIFDLLYDDDVIPDETFKRWEQSSDPDEMEGKGVALLSVSPFFTWLREAESGDSDPPAEEDPAALPPT